MISRAWSVFGIAALGMMSASSNLPASGSNETGWVDALKPRGKPGPELTIAAGGKTDYVILLPAAPTSQEMKAASEIALHLNQMTQASLPEVVEGQPNLPAFAKVISLGQTERLKKTTLAEKAVDLGDEGYAIAAAGEDLFLFGGAQRGPLCAVFALLEEDLGVRWYSIDQSTPGVTRIPRTPDLRFRPVPRTYVPGFELRQPLIRETHNEIWALRNRVNAQYALAQIREEWGGSIPLVRELFCHTFNRLVPRDKYFQDHPEYFSMRDGRRSPHQLCAGNPDVVRIITAALLARVKTGREIFSISPNDGGGWCECPECKALNDAEGSGGAAHLRLCNNVARALAEKYPGVRISHLAYLGADTAPRTILPHPNVIVQFCTDHDAWRWPFIPYAQTTVTRERLKGWIDKGACVHVWDYVTNYSHASLPLPNLTVVAENLRFFAENKVKGMFLEGDQHVGSDRAALRSWVWAKLLWDPSLDPREVIRDFTYGCYGPAAEPLQQYNELLDRIYAENLPRFKAEYEIGYEALYNIRFDPAVVFLSKGPYLDEASKLFESAEQLAAESGDQDLVRRVKRAKLPLLYTKLCRGPGYRSFETYHFYESKERYLDMIDQFESITGEERITIVTDGRWDRYPVGADVRNSVAAWRKRLARAEVEK